MTLWQPSVMQLLLLLLLLLHSSLVATPTSRCHITVPSLCHRRSSTHHTLPPTLPQARFPPGWCAKLHGRMSSDEKAAVLHDFKEGSTRLLVASTVVEVGVDVREASVMVVEHAER